MDKRKAPAGLSVIRLETRIRAPIASCFDLARSIDGHMDSVSKTGEKAIGGRLSGRVELGDAITWRARHLGIWQTLSVEITVMEPPHRFVDEMVEGAFRYMRHDHIFQSLSDDETLMIDDFRFAAPFGPLGQLVCRIFLKGYMQRFLLTRNAWLKQKLEESHGPRAAGYGQKAQEKAPD